MPQFVEQCPACNNPIYLEDNVQGSCECLEGGLRQLLARKQRARGGVQYVGRDTRPTMARVASQATQRPQLQARQLPELSPEMFLSNGALREVQAASQVLGPRPPAPVDPRRVTSEQWATGRHSGEGFDLDLSMDSAIEQAMNERAQETAELASSIANLWRGSVARDIGEDAASIEFTTNEDISFEPPDLPVRAPLPDPRNPRFRVDRPPPGPPPFRRETMNADGYDVIPYEETPRPMREIGQVRGARILTDRGARPAPPMREAVTNLNGDTSSLQAIRDRARTHYYPEGVQAPIRIPAKDANGRTAEQRMAEHMRRPTAYEHLVRSDPFEDVDF